MISALRTVILKAGNGGDTHERKAPEYEGERQNHPLHHRRCGRAVRRGVRRREALPRREKEEISQNAEPALRRLAEPVFCLLIRILLSDLDTR